MADHQVGDSDPEALERECLSMLGLAIFTILLMRSLEGPEQGGAKPIQQGGANVKAATSATARLSATVGPVNWNVTKLEKASIPSPTMTVAALAINAAPTCLDRLAECRDRRSTKPQLLTISRDQERQ